MGECINPAMQTRHRTPQNLNLCGPRLPTVVGFDSSFIFSLKPQACRAERRFFVMSYFSRNGALYLNAEVILSRAPGRGPRPSAFVFESRE